MRLIDADKLIEVLNKKSVPFNANINDAILTAPTVDAVEVVRCKDCKYAEEEKTEHPYGVLCNHATVGGYGDVFDFMHYCSFGEREEK